MTYYGKIKNYDSSIGKGRITPENGGDILAFRKSDLKDEDSAPQLDQRYGYDVKDADNGKRYAVNVHLQAETANTVKEQARNQAG
ncbi:cold-shock protein [Altererythrobacter sp. BO-6]|uniref:cold-shock protein n=1 Tax=Altererythrobacter sp. BO-6 TaxID=2604537 RepID=UPI0013E0EDCD|nr:cold-shock protein [Altererythrobacter sp. BO-6]QIG53747.1 cold-shock protein [Altererythrobacter sp. BO-6]